MEKGCLGNQKEIMGKSRKTVILPPLLDSFIPDECFIPLRRPPPVLHISDFFVGPVGTAQARWFVPQVVALRGVAVVAVFLIIVVQQTRRLEVSPILD